MSIQDLAKSIAERNNTTIVEKKFNALDIAFYVKLYANHIALNGTCAYTLSEKALEQLF